jgi:hypothetical protein
VETRAGFGEDRVEGDELLVEEDELALGRDHRGGVVEELP